MPHTTRPAVARTAALSSSCLLVVASTGFGCVFAWGQGSQHGPLMAALSVVMATGLELAKPLAVTGAFAAARDWQPGRALGLALLAVLAVAYSLTAELTLMAGTRGDLAAERAERADAATNARSRRDRIEAELTALGTLRPATTIHAEIEGLLIDPRVGDCSKIDGPKSRATCPVVANLRAELATTERRETLERTLAGLSAPPGATAAAAVKAADPGATALVAYLTALGLTNVSPAGIAEFLVLVPVLALEIGSALAAVLARSPVETPTAPAGSVHATRSCVDLEPTEPGLDTLARPEGAAVDTQSAGRTGAEACGQGVSKGARGQVQGPTSAVQGRRHGQPTDVGKKAAESRIVDALRSRGGSLDASVRALAVSIGAKRSTVHNALVGLLAAGVVVRAGGALVLRV